MLIKEIVDNLIEECDTQLECKEKIDYRWHKGGSAVSDILMSFYRDVFE